MIVARGTPDPADIARATAREVLRHACALYVALEMSQMIPAAVGHPATNDLRELAARLEGDMNFLSPRHELKKGQLNQMRTLSYLAQDTAAERLVADLEARLRELALQSLNRTNPAAA